VLYTSAANAQDKRRKGGEDGMVRIRRNFKEGDAQSTYVPQFSG
jgi:hypothetical protein